jgi:hypothetical protein
VFNSGFAEASVNSMVTFGTRVVQDIDDHYSPDASTLSRNFEDSDDEDEEMFLDADEDHSVVFSDSDLAQSRHLTPASVVSTIPTEDSDEAGFVDTDDGAQRNVRQKSIHPSSPRSAERTLNEHEHEVAKPLHRTISRVIVRDASFATYRSVLYYVRCIAILFLPIVDHVSSDIYRQHRFRPAIFLLYS